MRSLFIFGALAVSVIVGSVVGSLWNFFFGAAASLVLFGAFFLQALWKIPAAPPHVGLLTFFGQRKNQALKEGWRILPFRPAVFDVIDVSVEKVNQDFPETKVRTRDLAEVSVPISLTWSPDPGHLIEFLNTGGKSGVESILTDIVRDRLREWAISPTEGPMRWDEAVGLNEEATAVLFKAILGNSLESIPSSVPTRILLKFFGSPRKPLLESEVVEWGNPELAAQLRNAQNQEERQGLLQAINWQPDDSWANTLDRIHLDIANRVAQDMSSLRATVESRRADIQNARRGSGTFAKPDLGIFIHRINIEEIQPVGDVAQAAEQAAKERQQQNAEAVEIGHIIQQVERLKGAISGLTSEQAIEIVQSERNKVTKQISESKFSVSPEFRSMIEQVFAGLLSTLAGRRAS